MLYVPLHNHLVDNLPRSCVGSLQAHSAGLQVIITYEYICCPSGLSSTEVT